MNTMEDLEIKPLKTFQQRYRRNLLTGAQKSSTCLDQQSLIDYVEADEDYIISAGRDHDINIWDAIEGKHIRRLSGHLAPVTGLSLFDSVHWASEKIIVSSSEDGSVRVWSLSKGEEINKIKTRNVITCLGILNKSLAVTGNHKGYMEVHHIRSRELYTSIRAHTDPIDALEVRDNYACTAIFEAPSCLKVWDIEFEHTRCIYHIENSPEIEFCCMSVWSTKVILGASNQQKLFVFDFLKDEESTIDLGRPNGYVRRVKAWNEWIISCSIHQTNVLLDVHRFPSYENFGTYAANVHQVNAIAAIESESSFKILVGGSALVALRFDFILTDEETDIPLISRYMLASEESYFMQNKEISPYTIKKTDDFDDGKLTDSEIDDSKDETLPKYFENMGFGLQQETADEMHYPHQNMEMASTPGITETILPNCYENRAFTPHSDSDKMSEAVTEIVDDKSESEMQAGKTEMLSVLTVATTETYMYEDKKSASPTEMITEPRVAMRKLKKELEDDKLPEDWENATIKNEYNENENDSVIIINDEVDKNEIKKENAEVEVVDLVDQDDNEENDVKITENFNSDSIKEKEAEMLVISRKKSKKCKKDKKDWENATIKDEYNENENDSVINDEVDKNEIKKENAEVAVVDLVDQDDNAEMLVISTKKSKKCKKDKKDKNKEPQKSKHKCEIM